MHYIQHIYCFFIYIHQLNTIGCFWQTKCIIQKSLYYINLPKNNVPQCYYNIIFYYIIYANWRLHVSLHRETCNHSAYICKIKHINFFYFIMFFNKLFFLLCLLVLVTFVILNKNSSRIFKTIQVSYSDDIPIKRLPKAIIIGSPKCGLFWLFLKFLTVVQNLITVKKKASIVALKPSIVGYKPSIVGYIPSLVGL